MSSAATAATTADHSELRILLVEDNANDVELALLELRRQGLSVVADVVHDADEFVRLLQSNRYDLVLTDYNLPQWRGMDALGTIRARGLDLPLILVTGSLGEEKAVECLKLGASDYVLKDNLARLPSAVRAALKEKRLRAERTQAQEELAEKVKELARSNSDLEQFAYVTSHDLQEPLRMIASYTRLLGDRYSGKLDDKADTYIRYAVEGAERMQALIQDLLAFSRVGRQGIDWRPTDCNLVVQEALSNLRMVIEETGATVTYSALPTILADSPLLLQVFQNLIANAIKFRGAKAPVVHIEAEKRNGIEWLFTCTDNGIGISPEYAEVVFTIFKRLHTRAEYPGNGIGLSLSKRIIEHHGGTIWVESKPGEGSSFRFTLAIRTADSTPT